MIVFQTFNLIFDVKGCFFVLKLVKRTIIYLILREKWQKFKLTINLQGIQVIVTNSPLWKARGISQYIYSPKTQITFPRATRLRLIFAPSLNLGRVLHPKPLLSLPLVACPMACALSLPARSTRCRRLQHPSGVEQEIVNTEWLLLERRLLEVAATRRFPLPAERQKRSWAGFETRCSVNPNKNTKAK